MADSVWGRRPMAVHLKTLWPLRLGGSWGGHMAQFWPRRLKWKSARDLGKLVAFLIGKLFLPPQLLPAWNFDAMPRGVVAILQPWDNPGQKIVLEALDIRGSSQPSCHVLGTPTSLIIFWASRRTIPSVKPSHGEKLSFGWLSLLGAVTGGSFPEWNLGVTVGQLCLL